jgi:hypothetical protein
MCTVSVILKSDEIIITSNRDEKTLRLPALAPQKYNLNKKAIFFAKDTQANGTWFAADNKGNAVVLLNGAFKKHESKPPYFKSRGLVVLDIISDINPIDSLEQYQLQDIEPFQVIVKYEKLIKRMVWDGNQKHFSDLISPYSIFSSVTLYEEEIICEREQQFLSFLEVNPHPEASNLFEFHQQNHDEENGFVMNRNNLVKTISISQLVIGKETTFYKYLDLQNNSETTHQILL